MLRDGFRIWLKNPSTAVPFVIHQFVRYGILTILVLYMMIELGTLSVSQIFSHLNDFVSAIAVATIADLIIESYFVSAEIKACHDAINGELNLDRAFKFAVKRTPSMFAIVLMISISSIPAITGLLKKDVTLIAVSTIYLTVLAILFTFAPIAVVIDELDPIESILKSIKIVKNRIKDVLAMWALFGLVLISYALLLRLSMFFSLALVFILNLLIFPAVIMPILFNWWILLYMR